MAQIPAICTVCDTNFQSPLKMIPGTTIHQSLTNCPYCDNSARILDGYVTIIKGLISFVTSTDYSYEEKKDFLSEVRSAVKSELNEVEAERILKPINKEGWALIRECAGLGISFLALIISTASFLLTYHESGRNEPLEEVAVERVDQILSGEVDFEPIELSAERKPTPGPVFSAPEPEIEDVQRSGSEPKSPDEGG